MQDVPKAVGEGRSPLTRGRRHQRHHAAAGRGSIPAHAGKTTARVGLRDSRGVDPRSRGEDSRPKIRSPRYCGRSPLTRGRRTQTPAANRRGRSIPAHAGKTAGRRISCMSARVDPRSRGEDSFGPMATPSASGRSPLTRGRPQRTRVGVAGAGSIPAHAGKTDAAEVLTMKPQVDPRSRGEDRRAAISRARRAGRSPLTRGRHVHLDRLASHRRSIPAHAGKTSSRPGRC